MTYLPYRRKLACLLAALHILMSSVGLCVPQVHAQTLDTEPPDVGFDAVDESRKGDSQVFTVTATDNESIQSVVIFYRLGPDATYQATDMTRIGATDLYTLTIPAESIPQSVELIQYYIEAKDQAGNRTLQGFSFDPAERVLVDFGSTNAVNTSPQTEEQAEPEPRSESVLGSLSTTQKVVYTALGVIVVGALIAAAGSDSEGSAQTTQVTLTVPALEVGQ